MLLLALSVSSAFTAEYRDPKGVFAISYDDRIWSLDIDQSGDFGVECREEVCKEALASCTASKGRARSGSAESILANFDVEEMARDQLDAFAKQKAEAEKNAFDVSWDKTSDIQPHLVQPYALRRIAGNAFLEAEFRASILGEPVRYVSYVTAGAGHAIVMICHASESVAAEWRPRFEALLASLRSPAPKSR